MTFDFSLPVIGLYILGQQNEYVMSKQLFKSATSIGANVEETNAAQTKRDFIMKMSIASKEARDTRYGLRLMERSQLLKEDYSSYQVAIEPSIKILTKKQARNL